MSNWNYDSNKKGECLMKYIAKFEKVSFERFKKDYIDTFLRVEDNFEPSEELIAEIQKAYDTVTIPQRATRGSAGYDFVTPISFSLEPNETIKIPTGIRAKIDESWVLKCYPRSGLGFKYRLQLNNTVGIIDSDYYFSDNEGHIFAKVTNDTNENKTVNINAGDRFMQGVFVEYGITVDDEVENVRNGGMGSTDKR